jgi:carboxyl-terminal processing protease
MLPMENQAAGGHEAFPDVCPTGAPPVPVPYPNLSLNATAQPSSPNILLTGAPALNTGSSSPITLGDNAAVPGTSMRPQVTTAGKPKVLVNGLPATTLTSTTTGNASNCAGAKLVPSATNVFIDLVAPAATPADELAGLLHALPRDGSTVDEALFAGGVLCLRLRVFSADVPARVFAALSRRQPRALLLDLRDNPGGEVRAAVELAGDFLDDPGSEIVTMRDREGDDLTYRAGSGRPHRLPLVVLVNRRTASAAEIFAGALQHHRRALIAGERTYGKGVGHAVVAGSGGLGRVYATYVLPGGAAIEGAGIHPDAALLVAPGQDALAQALKLLEQVG